MEKNNQKFLGIVQAMIAFVTDKDVKLSLFWSRRRWDNHDWSDWDVLMRCHEWLTPHERNKIRMLVWSLPWKVDIVDWDKISESMREEIETG